jgi:hypothetical protein
MYLCSIFLLLFKGYLCSYLSYFNTHDLRVNVPKKVKNLTKMEQKRSPTIAIIRYTLMSSISI